MSLYELNARMAVKLGQSLDTFENMPYMDYSFYINIIKKDIEDKNKSILKETESDAPNIPMKVNLPDSLKLK